MWWDGPKWLKQDPFAMPPQPLVEAIPTPELKVVCNVVTPFFPTWIEDTFSVYHKLLHVNAWCRRFIANLKSTINHLPRTNSPHLITEVESSEKHLFRLAQQRAFATELINLNQGQLVSSSSSIKSLSPLHGQRWTHPCRGKAGSVPSQIHPVILSSKSRVVYIMFHTKHVSLGHCGPSLILSATGTRVYVLRAKRLSRTIYRRCVICRKANAKTRPQMMGQLPENRVKPSPAFTISGIDYAGPAS